MSAAATASIRWRVSTSASQTEEWATPLPLYLTLHAEFGFTLDAAAGSSNAKHVRYVDKDTDALATSWAGERVYVNPPYGRDLGRWVQKAADEARDHRALVVMLVPARTGTRWFHDVVLTRASEVRFCRGRLNFTRSSGPGAGRKNAPFDSMVVIFRPGDQTDGPPLCGGRQLIFPFGLGLDAEPGAAT